MVDGASSTDWGRYVRTNSERCRYYSVSRNYNLIFYLIDSGRNDINIEKRIFEILRYDRKN